MIPRTGMIQFTQPSMTLLRRAAAPRSSSSAAAGGWLKQHQQFTTSSGGMGTTSSSASTNPVPRRGLTIFVGGALIAGGYLLFSKGKEKPDQSGPLPPPERAPPVSAATKRVDTVPAKAQESAGLEVKQ